MKTDLERINSFLNQHHVLSLATSDEKELSVCSLFYAYAEDEHSFVVASSDTTTHIKHLEKNQHVAGNILLETKIIGKIQGVQFCAQMFVLDEKSLSKRYFKRFPHAKLMNPKLWKIVVSEFKMTDNTLGFGKKIKHSFI